MDRAVRKIKKQLPHLKLHKLMGDVSYWGVAVRVLLLGFLLLISLTLRAVHSQTLDPAPKLYVAFVSETYLAMFFLAIYVLFDAGYVTICKSYARIHWVDKLVDLGGSLAIAGLYLSFYYIEVPIVVAQAVQWLPVVVLFVLALRLVYGAFWSGRPSR